MNRLRTLFAVFLTITVSGGVAFAASDGVKPPRKMEWAFEGVFGKVDRQAAQRGFQVYQEVCAACHGLSRIAYRNLSEIGFTEAEIKTLAAEQLVPDGPNDEGDMFERAGVPSDFFPSPFANEQAARSAHNGAYPPDLSLIVKARADGANYLYSLMVGYTDAPKGVELSDGQSYNPYFPGGALSMPPPLSDGQVDYSDGTTASVHQMSHDVTTFLQWAAEPEMEKRKRMGIKVLIYLAIFTAFMYVAKRNIWRRLH